MIKALFFTLFLFSGSFTELGTSQRNESQETQVYICVSSTAKRYHLIKNCRGLNACTHEIRSMNKSTAINTYGRDLCRWED